MTNILNDTSLESVRKQITVGRSFVFLPGSTIKKLGLSWLASTPGQSSSPQIVSAFANEKVSLCGININQSKFDPLTLQSVISDKTLYCAQKDTVNLFVLNPLCPDDVAIVTLKSGGTVLSRHTVSLGKHGDGHLKLHDLPVGDYEISFDGEKESACDFVVAEYRLVPLVASVSNSKTTADGALAVTFRLDSFGVAVNGKVQLNLLDRTTSISSFTAEARDGIAEASFKLTGEGPHQVAIQLANDPSKTATVPLRGSRESERSNTIFSPLGEEVVGSLIPTDFSTPVRGIHLQEGALKTTPISLEKVASNKACFRLNTTVQILKIVKVDPSYPRARANCVQSTNATYPGHDDAKFREATELLRKHNAPEARAIFEQARKESDNPHPFYAYSIACCHAQEGDKDNAVKWLKKAICDGWTDYDRMIDDPDLASLNGYDLYEALHQKGVHEFSYGALQAGETIELETASPVCVYLIGAFIDGKPWEGWASIVTPSTVTTDVVVPDTIVPGTTATIEVNASHGASVYAIVKDARLISSDTPELRLAASIKKYVEVAGGKLNVGYPSETLYSLMHLPQYGVPLTLAESIRQKLSEGTTSSDQSIDTLQRITGTGSSGGWGATANFVGSNSSASWDVPIQARQAPAPSGGMFEPASAPPPAGFGGTIRRLFGMDARTEEEADEFSTGAKPRLKAYKASSRASVGEKFGMAQMTTLAPMAESIAKSKSQPKEVVRVTESPEVLYAGPVQITDGKGTLTLQLPDMFADYVIECFAINGMNWASKETMFRAEKDTFVQLVTPVFARIGEPCTATIHVSSIEAVTLKVNLNGKAIELFDDNGKLFSGTHSGPPAALTFQAEPGMYEAIIEQNGVVVDRQVKLVNEPGKLKRIARTMRLLESGQSLDLGTAFGLSLLPGLDTSFTVLVDATSDYSHCCCEQTAAKLLSGCAMYMLSNGDGNRRKKAEAIIIAGVAREKQMWIKGRGLKSYPHLPSIPDQYVGPRAARYLWNLGLLTGDSDMSHSLQQAIKDGLEIAEDTTKAYGFAWPPASPKSCEEAYQLLRFSNDSQTRQALEFVEKRVNEVEKHNLVSQTETWLGRSVNNRIETAYAAAVLLKAGRGAQHLRSALDLANFVIGQFNEQGRLYSTADSVAAIALMTELQKAGITKSSGKVEVNGKIISTDDALKLTDALTSVKVIEGICTVAVDQVVEESWEKLESSVPVRISLEKNNRHTRNFTTGDTIELTVTLEQGYKMGDLLWVALPDALSRIAGGGQVKLFSVDFCGQTEVRVALAATGVTDSIDGTAGKQSMAICVRNMFDEERAGCPGLIPISVKQG